MTSLVILAFVSSSVLLVISRSITSAADSAFRMEAFKLARENMEVFLSANSATEMVEYGTSERYPGISWRTMVETFSEPVTSQMWVRAVCSAEFTDSTGETQRVELVNWLSQLTDQQASQLAQEGGQDLGALAAEQLMEYIETAAQYARVDAETIEQWLGNGLVTTASGAFIKYNLDIFVRREGAPTDAEKAQQVGTLEELAAALTGVREGGASNDDNPTAGMLRDSVYP
jgi:type II secretory pathway pseudopilin PulG